MKFSPTFSLVFGCLGGLLGLLHDWSGYRAAIASAKAAGQPAPDFDYIATITNVAKGFGAGVTAGLGLAQVPGTNP